MTSPLSRIKSWLWPQRPEREIRFNDAGFTVVLEDKVEMRAEWSRVREVFAYKQDLFAYDEMRVGFRFDEDGSHWWVGEDFSGFRELLDELPSRFSGIRRSEERRVG